MSVRDCWCCGNTGQQWGNNPAIMMCTRHPEGLIQWVVGKKYQSEVRDDADIPAGLDLYAHRDD
ncbi:MAG: hypothetical protein ACREHG_02080 [Candidatus Saccharimonadales bacterium]